MGGEGGGKGGGGGHGTLASLARNNGGTHEAEVKDNPQSSSRPQASSDHSKCSPSVKQACLGLLTCRQLEYADPAPLCRHTRTGLPSLQIEPPPSLQVMPYCGHHENSWYAKTSFVVVRPTLSNLCQRTLRSKRGECCCPKCKSTKALHLGQFFRCGVHSKGSALAVGEYPHDFCHKKVALWTLNR